MPGPLHYNIDISFDLSEVSRAKVTYTNGVWVRARILRWAEGLARGELLICWPVCKVGEADADPPKVGDGIGIISRKNCSGAQPDCSSEHKS